MFAANEREKDQHVQLPREPVTKQLNVSPEHDVGLNDMYPTNVSGEKEISLHTSSTTRDDAAGKEFNGAVVDQTGEQVPPREEVKPK
jgi:hypothetical protein